MCRLTYSHCQKRESDLGCGGSSLNSNIPHPSQLRDIISSAFPGNARGESPSWTCSNPSPHTFWQFLDRRLNHCSTVLLICWSNSSEFLSLSPGTVSAACICNIVLVGRKKPPQKKQNNIVAALSSNNLSVQRPHHCKHYTELPVNLMFHCTLASEQDPETVEFVHLGQQLIFKPEVGTHPFSVESHGTRCKSVSLWLPFNEATRPTSSAKKTTRDPEIWKVLGFMNIVSDKGQP